MKEMVHGDAFEILPTLKQTFDTVIMCLWKNPSEEEIDQLLEHSLRLARHNVVIETVAEWEYHAICYRVGRILTLDEILWIKHQHTMRGHRGPVDRTERIAVIRQNRESFYRDIVTLGRPTHGENGWNLEGRKTLGDVWHGPRPVRGTIKKMGLTDTPQPSWLLEQLLYCYVPPGGSVLEVGAGSGTGLRAAKRLGLDYIGIERDSRQVAAATRWMDIEPIVKVPQVEQDAYMSLVAARNNNLYAHNIQRRTA